MCVQVTPLLPAPLPCAAGCVAGCVGFEATVGSAGAFGDTFVVGVAAGAFGVTAWLGVALLCGQTYSMSSDIQAMAQVAASCRLGRVTSITMVMTPLLAFAGRRLALRLTANRTLDVELTVRPRDAQKHAIVVG